MNYSKTVRQALAQAGFSSTPTIFTGKSYGLRRVKIWQGTGIFEASQRQQRKLERALKAAFGPRWISANFVRGSMVFPTIFTASLVIWLTPE